ncbi:MAG: Uncharacterised protein [Synechococcus sp. MIT S9220]|nr:MAG: Uncharacterised protein [Synechococcus sp. MIT S9220]
MHGVAAVHEALRDRDRFIGMSCGVTPPGSETSQKSRQTIAFGWILQITRTHIETILEKTAVLLSETHREQIRLKSPCLENRLEFVVAHGSGAIDLTIEQVPGCRFLLNQPHGVQSEPVALQPVPDVEFIPEKPGANALPLQIGSLLDT